jgi:hypothetical protein
VGDFARSLERFAAKVPDKAETIITKVCLLLHRQIVMATPVGNPDLWKNPPPAGYVGGRLRANWNTGFGSIDATEHGPDKSGAATLGRATVELLARPKGRDVYITNSLSYAIPIEYGGSTQAPSGMVRVAVQAFDGIVRDEAAKEARK